MQDGENRMPFEKKNMRLARKRVDWEVRLNPNEVWQRIESVSDSKKRMFFAPLKYEGDQPFLYTIVGNTIVIQKRLRRRNDFQTELQLQIEPLSFGSKLKGSFGIPLFSMIFFTIFMAITGFFSLWAMIGLINNKFDNDNTAKVVFVVVPFSMFAFALISLVKGLISMKMTEQAISKWLDGLFADVLCEKKLS